MTSPDTHVKTQELLSRNGHFGADSSQIILLMQEQVPALADSEAHIALSSEDSR
jgi:UDP-sugar pyrophosphorylase